MSRFAIAFSAIFAAVALRGAVGSVTVTNGPPLHSDGEISTHARLPAWSGRERLFRLEIGLATAASNNVEAAFGRDADGDGFLPAEEAALTVGWLDGRWFAFSRDRRTICASAPVGGTASRALSLSLRLGPGFAPRAAVCADEAGAPVAIAGIDGVLTGARPAEWDTVRLTARGPDACGGAATVTLLADGTLLLLR